MFLQNEWRNIDNFFVEKEYFLAKKNFNIDLKYTELVDWQYVRRYMIHNDLESKMSCECMMLETPE